MASKTGRPTKYPGETLTDQIIFRVPKGLKMSAKSKAEKQEQTMTEYLIALLEADARRDQSSAA